LKTPFFALAGAFLITLPFCTTAVAVPAPQLCTDGANSASTECRHPIEVPFTLYRGYAIVVHGSIGGLKDLNLLIDTGAVPSVLDERIARKLHLKCEAEQLSVLTKKVQTARSVAHDIRIGPLKVRDFRVVVQDLSFASDALMTRVDAMIGFEVLGQFPFTIDYDSQKVIFGPIDPSFVSVPYHTGLPYVIVDLQIQGQEVAILVDTGASNLVLFESKVRECARSITLRDELIWSNMGGEMHVMEAELTEAYLGKMPWAGRVAYVLKNSGEGPSGLAGMLGTTALNARRIAFDPEHKVLAWDLPTQHRSIN